MRPVKGLPEYVLDDIQKEMVGYNNVISPAYFQRLAPTEVDGKWVLVIIARTGQQRPYKAPDYVTGKKDKSTIITFVMAQALSEQIQSRNGS